MRTLILMISSTFFVAACSSVSEEPNIAASYANESENPLDILVENPIVGGVFYVLEATVNGAERGTNALLGRSE
jgi:hypothetical protein